MELVTSPSPLSFFAPRAHLPPCRRSGQLAFTLMELLVVMALIGLTLGFILPAVQSTIDAIQLTEAGNRVAALFEKGRMHATTTRKVTILRFFLDPEDNSGEIRYIQLFEIPDSSSGLAADAQAISIAYHLEDALKVSMDYSPLFENEQIRHGNGPLKQYQEVAYSEFYIFPNGTTSLAASSPNPHLAMVSRRDSKTAPRNPVVISFDSTTAKVTQFRR